MLYKIGGVHFRLLGTNSFHVKAKNERFTAASSRCRQQNLKYENFHVVVWQTTSKHCTKERAAHAARLFLFVQPIKSLLCGVVVDVAVVKSKTPCYGHFVGVALYSPSILSFSHCLFLRPSSNVELLMCRI